jgi:hypothetical protein
MNQRSKLRVPSGAKARSFCGLAGTAKAVPCPKPIYEMASNHFMRVANEKGRTKSSGGPEFFSNLVLPQDCAFLREAQAIL